MIRVAAASLAGALILLAAYWSLRLAWADYLFRKNDPESVARAVELAPGNAHYRLRQGDAEAATRLDPLSASGWVQLGLARERHGLFVGAEDALLEAARVDATYLPRWTLANYYFRRGNWPEFWRWVREAAHISPGNSQALFQLCWRATDDADFLLNQILPDDPSTLTKYFAFLVSGNRLAAAGPVAVKLLGKSQPQNLGVMLDYCDRLLESSDWPVALRVWNLLAYRRVLPYSPLDPDRGVSLTNGGLANQPLSRGFDWRFLSAKGISLIIPRPSGGLRFVFSGHQAERCDILDQRLPLLPRRTYRLSYTYSTSGASAVAGVRWRVLNAATGKAIAPSTSLSGHTAWTEEGFSFQTPAQTPADSPLARLVLVYERAPGTTRLEGWLAFRGVTLELH